MARTATAPIASAKTAAAHARTKRAGTEARQSVDDIKDDIASLKSRLESLAAAGGSEGLASAREVFGRLQNRFEDFLDTDFAEQFGVNAAIDKSREQVENVRERVQDNPLQSVLIAAGVGAIVGFIMRR